MNKKVFIKAVQAALLAGMSSSIAFSSSHREAPFISEMPKVDATDFYMFNSYEPGREGYVTLLANYIPLQDAYGGPNYFTMDPDAVYDINISNDDDPNEEIVFRFQFKNKSEDIALDIDGKQVSIPLRQAGQIGVGGDPADIAALNEKESYSIKVFYKDKGKKSYKLTNSDTGSKYFMKPVDNIGSKTLPDYASYADNHIFNVDIPRCGQGRVFVGQRQEGFAVNLGGVFDLVNFVPVEPSFNPVFEGVGIEQNVANNTIRNKNTTTIALEVPVDCLTKGDDTSIGAWTSASLKQKRTLNTRGVKHRRDRKNLAEFTTKSCKLAQVSRLGSPLVNEVVIGLKDKDLFNRSMPKNDGQFADYVTNPTLPALLDILFRDPVNSLLGTEIPNLAPTNFPRTDLVTAFLTGFDGLNKTSGVGEMLRLNTAISATSKDEQHHLGVAAGDVAGFPNGRRPGDDVVDVALRVVMGALCHDLPLGPEGSGVNLGLCNPEDAVVGTVPFTDGAPVNAGDFQNAFPYLNTPVAGYPDPSSIL